MKSLKKIYLIVIILVFTSLGAFAQLTEPGDGAGGAPTGHTTIGGSAPIGNGLVILFVLGMAYGYRKVYQLKLKDV